LLIVWIACLLLANIPTALQADSIDDKSYKNVEIYDGGEEECVQAYLNLTPPANLQSKE
jgi:hypothetical protein